MRATEKDPFILKTLEDIEKIQKYVDSGEYNFSDVCFKFGADIELSSDFNSIGELKAGAGESMGKNIYPFSGILDGDNYTIIYPFGTTNPLFNYVREATVKNLNIYGEFINNYGLVSNYIIDYGKDGDYSVGTGGSYAEGCPDTITIDNVTIKSGTTISKSGFIGGSGSGGNIILIRNSTVEAGVKIGWNAENNKSAENDRVGSMAGGMNGVVMNCVSYAEVYGNNSVGGLVAQKMQSMGLFEVKNSSFHGTVNASDSVGGIFGGEGGQMQSWDNGVGYIRNNCFVGKVSATGTGKYVGGICGYMRSLNRYNIIENNYFLDVCGTSKGIGGALIVDTNCIDRHPAWIGDVFYINTALDDLDKIDQVFIERLNLDKGYHYIASNDHNREDDPLGVDSDRLAKRMTKEQFTDGTVVEALNSSESSLKNWMQGEGGYPVHKDMPIAEDLTISGVYKTDYYIGETLDFSGMIIHVLWSDGATTEVDLDEINVSGFDSSKRATVVLTLEYGAAKKQIEIRVLKKPETNIKVTFSLLGDVIHDSDADGRVHTLAANNLSVWIPEKEYEVDLNATVMDVLETVLTEHGMSCSNPAGNYVESITKDGVTLAEFDNGVKSGWMYTLNGKHPTLAVNEQYLEDGDVIVFHYSDDYTVEEGSEGYNPVDPNKPTIPGGDSTQQPTTPTTPSVQLAEPTSVTLAKTSMTYTGKALEPDVTVTDSKGAVIEPVYYDVTYTDNKEAGKATVTITFKDKYATAKPLTATFTITKANASTIKVKDVVYTGKKISKSKLKLVTSEGVKLTSSEYKIKSIKNNKKIGKATIKVQFLGKNVQKKTRTLTFKIVPKSTNLKKLAKGKKQITLTWKAQKKQTTGYQIQYSTSKKFTKKTTKSVTAKISKTTATIKKLKAKKTYYVRIRTYKTVGKTKYYSVWSKVKSVKTK